MPVCPKGKPFTHKQQQELSNCSMDDGQMPPTVKKNDTSNSLNKLSFQQFKSSNCRLCITIAGYIALHMNYLIFDFCCSSKTPAVRGDLSPESPATPPTVRLRKKAYSDLPPKPIPLLSLSADEDSPTKPPGASKMDSAVESGDKSPINRTHSLPTDKVPKLELSCKSL